MSGDAPEAKKHAVLVVDDFADGREMYAEYLQFAGFAVETAEDGEEALAKARASHPDVILMDLSLPNVDGWEATRRLKADPATRHIQVLALTGHVMGSHREQARDAGCDDFLAKPALPDQVEAKIRALLAKKPAR